MAQVLAWALLAWLAAPGPQRAGALENGLARTPPMGWLAWERFVCQTDCRRYPDECIDESLFRQMGARLVSDGYLAAGYQYVNIDDCWSTRSRSPGDQRLVEDPTRFPSGLGNLSQFLHGLGLRLGIYGDCGTKTCQLYPGQLRYQDRADDNYFRLDADTFARWGIDSFKFDVCNVDQQLAGRVCPLMGAALNATGRPMLFSCSWPSMEQEANISSDWRMVADRCNLWRAYADIEDSWSSVLDVILFFSRPDRQELALRFHGPGRWFDPDMLLVGGFGLSAEQERSQMAIWCVWSAPMYMSNDLRNISAQSRALLLNTQLIQVNQDRYGVFGQRVAEKSQVLAFVKPVEPLDRHLCPSYVVVYFSKRTLGGPVWISFKLAELIGNLHGLFRKADVHQQWAHCSDRGDQVRFAVHDLFQAAPTSAPILDSPDSLALATGQLELKVNPSGVRAVKLTQVGAADLQNSNQNTLDSI